MTDLQIVDDLDQLTFADPALHLQCCTHDLFLCGIGFHPEMVAGDGDETCPACRKVFEQGRCTPANPHFHCPVVQRISGLWSICQGPVNAKVR